MVDLDIEKIDIHSLVPADYNPRKISDKDYANLKKSIDEFGIVDPIIVNLNDNTIISGHQRFDVLFYEQELSELLLIKLGDIGWVFTDTDLKVKDKNHEKTLNLALNRIHGEFDEDLLNEVLIELEEVKLDHLTGFDLELDDINYDFITRIEDEYEEEVVENTSEEETYEEDDFEEIIEEEIDIPTDSDRTVDDEIKNDKKDKSRIRRGFVKYGEIYKIGESSYLMFGKDTNEQDRTKLLNCNLQKQLPKIPKEVDKIKTIKQEINYYMCNDAEVIEDIIINNKKICKKIL